MLTPFFIVLVDINECDSNPCANSGTCTDGDHLFTCACAAGFMGATCDVGKIIFSFTNYIVSSSHGHCHSLYQPLGHFDNITILIHFCWSSASITHVVMPNPVHSAMSVSHVFFAITRQLKTVITLFPILIT